MCGPWSRNGSRSAWADYGSIGASVWAYSSRYYQPDAIIQECMPSFDQEPFQETLCTCCQEDVPHSLYIRPCHEEEESQRQRGQRHYRHDSKIFNTTDGSVVAERIVPAPMWDGLAIAQDKIFLSTLRGEVVCLGNTSK